MAFIVKKTKELKKDPVYTTEFKELYSTVIAEEIKPYILNITMGDIVKQTIKKYTTLFLTSKGYYVDYDAIYNFNFEIKNNFNNFISSKQRFVLIHISLTTKADNFTLICPSFLVKEEDFNESIQTGKLLEFYIKATLSCCTYIINH